MLGHGSESVELSFQEAVKAKAKDSQNIGDGGISPPLQLHTYMPFLYVLGMSLLPLIGCPLGDSSGGFGLMSECTKVHP